MASTILRFPHQEGNKRRSDVELKCLDIHKATARSYDRVIGAKLYLLVFQWCLSPLIFGDHHVRDDSDQTWHSCKCISPCCMPWETRYETCRNLWSAKQGMDVSVSFADERWKGHLSLRAFQGNDCNCTAFRWVCVPPNRDLLFQNDKQSVIVDSGFAGFKSLCSQVPHSLFLIRPGTQHGLLKALPPDSVLASRSWMPVCLPNYLPPFLCCMHLALRQICQNWSSVSAMVLWESRREYVFHVSFPSW